MSSLLSLCFVLCSSFGLEFSAWIRYFFSLLLVAATVWSWYPSKYLLQYNHMFIYALYWQGTGHVLSSFYSWFQTSAWNRADAQHIWCNLLCPAFSRFSKRLVSIGGEDRRLLTSNRHRLKEQRPWKEKKKINLWAVKRFIQKEMPSLVPMLSFILALSFIIHFI